MGFSQLRPTTAAPVVLVVLIGMLLLLASCQDNDRAGVSRVGATSSSLQHQMRKMLHNSGSGGGYWPERTSPDECSEEDVAVYQNNAPHLSSGIPAYSVEIINVCAGCTVYDVHIACGDFASTELVNPALFRRLAFDDCLVKGGAALGPGETVAFQYSNSFAYPLDVASVACN